MDNEIALWHNPEYVSVVTSVAAFFIIFGIVVYYLQTKNPKWIGVWAAIKSWVITSPIVFFFAALPTPWPLIFICVVAISGAKTFYQMTGMYHRSWFVWATYFFLILQGYSIYRGYDRFYNIMPMVFFICLTLIPILRNSATHMIQYMALALLNFIFMGWGFMHLGRMVLWSGGPLIVLFLVILFEFCESANYTITRAFGTHKPLDKITMRFSIEGFLISTALTILLAWGLRYMLPHHTEPYWLLGGLSVSIFGRIGGLLLTVIRRDLGIKESGIFIIGRDDILSRMDKAMFAAPAFYFGYLILEGTIQL
jgi:phosphatidate cytidylyltransferase